MSADKRVLLTVDLVAQPINLGDPISLFELGLCMREDQGASHIDVAVVFERALPSPIWPFRDYVNSDNINYHVGLVTETLRCLDGLGSLFIFDSHEDYWRYFVFAASRYLPYPNAAQLLQREYYFYDIYKRLHQRFRERGGLPTLNVNRGYGDWFTSFLARNVGARIPVSVQLRRNPANPDRDSDLPLWREFFQWATQAYPVSFLIIGFADEIAAELGDLDNVLFMKTFGTGVGEDLATVHGCAFHMGAASGPAQIATFARKPFWIFGAGDMARHLHMYDCLDLDGDLLRYRFCDFPHGVSLRPETAEDLRSVFQRLWTVGVSQEATDL